MNTNWFRRCGWFCVPVSAAGALIWLVAAAFCVTVVLAVDRHSHSVSDTFYGAFPFLACTFLLVDWISRRAGGERT